MNPIRFACLGLLLSAAGVNAQSPTVSDLGLVPGDASVAAAVNSQQDHAIARGGDQYLVVWSDYRGQSVGGGTSQGGGDIFGVRLDAQGQPLDATPFHVAGGMGLQNRPLVAWNGSAWLVLYLSQDPVGLYYDNVLRAVRVSASGEVLDATPVSFPPTTFTPNTVGLQLAGQNGQWLVTRCIYHEDAYGTYLAGQRIAADGTLLDTTPVMLMDWVYGGTVSLVANGEYLVAGPDWNSLNGAKARRVGQDGQPIGAPFTVPSLNLAGNGTEFYVTWVKDYVNMVGSRMTATGTLLTPAGTMILANFSQLGAPVLAHDGTQWWFLHGVGDQLRTMRISAAGTVLDTGGGVLLPISIGGSVNTAYGPVMASRPGGGVHLLWYDLREALGYDANVFVLPISAANAAGTERCVSTGTRNQRAPDLSHGPGGTAALVFVSEAANDRRVLLHLLDEDGHPTTAAPIEVAGAPAIGRASVAWNGSMFLVVWDGGVTGDPAQPIEGRRLNADGSFVDAAPFDIMSGFAPDVEALGDDFLVACARVHTYPQNIYAWMRVLDGPTRAFTNAATLIGGGYVAVGPNVCQDGARWVVTYESRWTHDSSQSDALYNFVSPDGSFTPALNPCTTSGGSGTPDVAFSGSRYLFVWRNNSLANANNYVAGRLMNADGSFATGNFVVAEATGRQLRPVVAWDGSNFQVVWDDQRNQGAFFDERTDLYGARVSEAGVVLDPTAYAVQAGPHGDATASLIARPDGHALVASSRFTLAPPFDSYRVGLTYVGEAGALGVDDGPTAALAVRGAPNPFRGSLTIAFALPRGGRVTLAVRDLQGRTVRTLEDGAVCPPGSHRRTWDGRDDAGTRVAPGVYLLSLRTPDGTVSRRVVAMGR